jgi:hypothetical protein
LQYFRNNQLLYKKDQKKWLPGKNHTEGERKRKERKEEGITEESLSFPLFFFVDQMLFGF